MRRRVHLVGNGVHFRDGFKEDTDPRFLKALQEQIREERARSMREDILAISRAQVKEQRKAEERDDRLWKLPKKPALQPPAPPPRDD